MSIDELLATGNKTTYPRYVNGLLIVTSIFLFFFSIQLMGSSISVLGIKFADEVIHATSNPFIGLFIGLLSTALLQSSSTTTTIAVAAVASGTITLQGAIPVIMGANVGTTLTSTVVSMGYITRSREFRKAVVAGTAHDFFNILMVILLFPLEANYRILENASNYISSFFYAESNSNASGLMLSGFADPVSDWLIGSFTAIPTLLFSILLLFICIKFISKLLYNILIGKARNRFESVIFKNKYLSFAWGMVITSLSQSSSLTTSLIVPLVATSKVKIRRAFQFILGANTGTTITALLAAIFQSEAAISLAIVHLLFNLIGVSIFLFIPVVNQIPVFLAEKMGAVTLRMRMVGFAYILVTFFLLPFTLIYFSTGPEKDPVSLDMKLED